jgi:hypothetical protein
MVSLQITFSGRSQMITHIVLFKLKERTDEGVAKAVALIMSMQGKVEMLRHLEAGADLIHSERSADVALVARFDSMEDLQAYQVHPYHANEVAAYMRSVSSSVVAADYETPKNHQKREIHEKSPRRSGRWSSVHVEPVWPTPSAASRSSRVSAPRRPRRR